MSEFSLYQSLVLGMLSIITLCALSMTFGLDRSLEKFCQRLEKALEDLRLETENVNSAIDQLTRPGQ